MHILYVLTDAERPRHSAHPLRADRRRTASSLNGEYDPPVPDLPDVTSKANPSAYLCRCWPRPALPLSLGHGESAGLVSGSPRFLGGGWSGWPNYSGEQWRADLGKPVEGVGELMRPGPTMVDSDSGSALPAYEAGGDVQQPVAQRLGFGFGPVSYTHLTLPTTPYV